MQDQKPKYFSGWHLLIDVLVLIVAASVYFRDIVTTREFEDYKVTHKEWSEEVFKNIDSSLSDIRNRADEAAKLGNENNAMLREIRVELKLNRIGAVDDGLMPRKIIGL